MCGNLLKASLVMMIRSTDKNNNSNRARNVKVVPVLLSTGRLTQCELDDEEEKDEEEFDEDSIESNDFGSGLSSSEEDTNVVDTYSANINRIKEKDENALAEEGVHALK